MKALDLSKYIIGCIPLDNLKLQKLLYYCQGIHLARVDEIIFKDEIQAWQYGPVVPNVYHEYKNFGLDIITLPDINDMVENIEMSEEERKTIDMVLEHYGIDSGPELVRRTHSELPWKKVYIPNKNNVISVESIKEYFKSNIEFEENEI